MNFLIFSGIVGLVCGLLVLLAPRRLKDIEATANKFMNRLISNVDSLIFKYNQGTGICLFLSGATLLFVAYYLSKR